MTGAALNHPLVRDYLRALDAALAVLPAGQAVELREQIAAHLEDTLAPDADDQTVAAALAQLGSPAALAAEAVGTDGSARSAWRSLRGRLARRGWRFWTGTATAVALVVVAAGYIIAVQTASELQFGGGAAWWYPQDSAHAVESYANGASQTTVPIRSGQWQGFVISLYNPSNWTQIVLGPAIGPNLPMDSPGSLSPQLSVSAFNRDINNGGLITAGVRFGLPGVIPPQQTRLLRVMWISTACLSPGTAQGTDELALRVRVGWITRVEIIQLNEGWYLSGPSRGFYSVQGRYCAG
jgi:hypothetical protein